MKPLYRSTSAIVELIGVNERFLSENKNKLFIKGIHFFIPKGKKNTLWSITEMIKWVENTSDDTYEDIADDVLSRMVS